MKTINDMSGKCCVNLSLTDEYPENIIPDQDVEICLKVIRTIRNQCFTNFDADGLVILSHAHAKIVEMVEKVMKVEENE